MESWRIYHRGVTQNNCRVSFGRLWVRPAPCPLSPALTGPGDAATIGVSSRPERAWREPHEAHVSTESTPSPENPWFPGPDEHQERPSRSEEAPREGSQASDCLHVLGVLPVAGLHGPRPTLSMSKRFGPEARLRSRRDYLTVQQSGRRIATRFLTMLVLPNTAGRDRLGIIASRKLGGAVVRNRAKRRIRELFRLRTGENLVPVDQGFDLVVIPRRELSSAPATALRADFAGALGRVARGARR